MISLYYDSSWTHINIFTGRHCKQTYDILKTDGCIFTSTQQIIKNRREYKIFLRNDCLFTFLYKNILWHFAIETFTAYGIKNQNILNEIITTLIVKLYLLLKVIQQNHLKDFYLSLKLGTHFNIEIKSISLSWEIAAYHG